MEGFGIKTMLDAKRIFDISFSIILSVILLPLILVLSLLILFFEGRPIFYISKRSKALNEEFDLVKFRTMSNTTEDYGVSGGDKSKRITNLGRYLRKTRLDELPQLWNIFKGDMSFVGPRPPLPEYVERFSDLYAKVLHNKPGVTGLASLYFHSHEEALLSKSQSPVETDAVYTRRCIPRKARLDLIYQKHQNLCFDISIILKTVVKCFY